MSVSPINKEASKYAEDNGLKIRHVNRLVKTFASVNADFSDDAPTYVGYAALLEGMKTHVAARPASERMAVREEPVDPYKEIGKRINQVRTERWTSTWKKEHQTLATTLDAMSEESRTQGYLFQKEKRPWHVHMKTGGYLGKFTNRKEAITFIRRMANAGFRNQLRITYEV